MLKDNINKTKKIKIPQHFNCYMTESFRPTYLMLKELSRVDESEEFKKYLSDVEDITWVKWLVRRERGEFAAYIRYALSIHTSMSIDLIRGSSQ